MTKSFTFLRRSINSLLRPFNLYLDSLTAKHVERSRILGLQSRGYFDEPRFPLPFGFINNFSENIFSSLERYQSRFDTFTDPKSNNVGFSYNNDFFSSPDVEILYSILMTHRPRRIIEIGCGNSTRIMRQAQLDGNWQCRITCIDPKPRLDVTEFADELRLTQVEQQNEMDLASLVQSGDCLFIDTSHIVHPGGDLAFLYLRLLPKIAAGVLVHIHDIFLPYDYPFRFAIGNGCEWGEQYIVQLLLTTCPSRYEVLWPGYYLQRTRNDYSQYFSHLNNRSAQSLWLRTLA